MLMPRLADMRRWCSSVERALVVDVNLVGGALRKDGTHEDEG